MGDRECRDITPWCKTRTKNSRLWFNMSRPTPPIYNLKWYNAETFDQQTLTLEWRWNVSGFKFCRSLLKNNQYCYPKLLYFQIFHQANSWWCSRYSRCQHVQGKMKIVYCNKWYKRTPEFDSWIQNNLKSVDIQHLHSKVKPHFVRPVSIWFPYQAFNKRWYHRTLWSRHVLS